MQCSLLSSMELNTTKCNSCSSPRLAALHNLRNLKQLTQCVGVHTCHSVIHISGLASPASKEWEPQGLQDCSQPLVCRDQSCLMKQIIVGMDKYHGFPFFPFCYLVGVASKLSTSILLGRGEFERDLFSPEVSDFLTLSNFLFSTTADGSASI